MSDRITIRNIRAYGKHGTLPHERDYLQPLDIDVELEADLSQARASDVLAHTIDYATIHSRIISIARTQSFALLERLAEELARALLTDPRVTFATVTVSKPNLLAGATPSVTIRAFAPPQRAKLFLKTKPAKTRPAKKKLSKTKAMKKIVEEAKPLKVQPSKRKR